MPRSLSTSPTLTVPAMLLIAALLPGCGERPTVAPVHAAPEPAVALSDAGALPEAPLWPEDSKVLLEGVRELAGKEHAVTHPSLLLYPPRTPSSRSAVLAFPGGGFKALAIGRESTIGPEGADVCGWLTAKGITCILVKYRVPDTACNWNWETRTHSSPEVPMALQDTQRAVSFVRHHAKDYGIAPDRIGVMGFSAGGYLAVLASTAFNARSYEPIDAIDQASSRPDFVIAVYPGHMTMEHKNKTPKQVAARELNTDIVISGGVPPTLLVHAKDDDVDPVHYSEVYARELRNAGLDVTLKVYASGGHAFGVRQQGADTDRWMGDALAWLRAKEMR